MTVLVDSYFSNNAWGKVYKGHLILGDGQVRVYDLTKEWLFRELDLPYKLEHSQQIKVLSGQVMAHIRAYAKNISSETVQTKQRGYDMGDGYTYLYGEEEPRSGILLAKTGGSTYRNSSPDTVALLRLIRTSVSEDTPCATCNQPNANLLHINALELLLFCTRDCYNEYSKGMNRSISAVGEDSQIGPRSDTSKMLQSGLASKLWPLLPSDDPLISSFSIGFALLLLYLGSGDGRATATLERVLAIVHTRDKQPVVVWMKEMHQRMEAEKAVRLISNNLLLYARGHTVTSEFQALAGGLVSLEGFASAKEAVKRANQWCAEKTENLITDCLTTEDVGPGTRAILINAIYFKAKWMKLFEAEKTHPGPFTQRDGSVSQRALMHQTAYFDYGEDEQFQYIKLHYKDSVFHGKSGYYMFIALPRLGGKDSPLTMMPIPKEFTEKKVVLTLPKFEHRARYELALLLSKMGLGLLFTNESDLSDILAQTLLKIDSVIHQVVVKVDEEGTEAAAVTVVVMRESMVMPKREKLIEFKADHSFYYAIVDGAQDTLLFSGIYNGQ